MERIKKEGNIEGRGCKYAKVVVARVWLCNHASRRTSRTAKLHLHVSWTV